MKLGQEMVTCAYISASGSPRAVTQALVNANQENTGYLAVTIAEADTHLAADTDNVTTVPVPKVQLLDKIDTTVSPAVEEDKYLRVYGALATFNAATGRCGVITKGIVPFRKGEASAATDIGKGIMAPTDHAQAAGRVGVPSAAGDGTGTVVGRSGEILWVDLDAEQAKV